MHKTDAQSLKRTEALCGQEIAVRRARAHRADHIRADGRWQQAKLDFAQTKSCRVHRNGHITGGHQAGAAGIHIALDAGNRWLGAFIQRAHHGGKTAGIFKVLRVRVIGHAAHPVQVCARAKSAAFSGQHDTAHVVPRAQLTESLSDFKNHRVVEGIAHLGAVERDGGHCAFKSDCQIAHFFIHTTLLSTAYRRHCRVPSREQALSAEEIASGPVREAQPPWSEKAMALGGARPR